MKNYKAVLFDLDGTLRTSQPEGFEAFAEYAGRVGLALSKEQIRFVEREAHAYWAGTRADDDMARYDQREFWVNYNRLLLHSIDIKDQDHCADQINDLFDEYDPIDVIFADTRVVLKQLKAENYIVGLVSNRSEDLAPHVERYGLTEFFDFTLSAGQAKCYKPAPAIFEKALAMAGNIAPQESVYVGDNFFADVVGARNAGMHVILVDPRNIFANDYEIRVRHLRDILKLL